jgi:hypothetical protein
MRTPAEFTGEKAHPPGQVDHLLGNLDITRTNYPAYTPKQNEYALRHFRVELEDAKLAQNKELERRESTRPKCSQPRQNERTPAGSDCQGSRLAGGRGRPPRSPRRQGVPADRGIRTSVSLYGSDLAHLEPLRAFLRQQTGPARD